MERDQPVAERPIGSRIFSSPVGNGGTPSFGAVPAAWRINPRANVGAGVMAALVSLPLAMGLGVLALSPLGPAFVSIGVLAGLYSAAFLGLVAVLAGARGVAIYAPRSLVSFMIAAVCADLLVGAAWLPKDDPPTVMAALFLLMSLAGLFQFMFGMLQLARIVKFIPTPVVAGFQNAASVIIIFSQLHLMFGLDNRPSLMEWPAALAESRPLTFILGAATLALVFAGPRITRRVPPMLTALIGGTILYYLLRIAGLDAQLGGTLGHIPVGVPDGKEFANIMLLTTRPGFAEALPAFVLAALSIAVVASLDVLISAKAVETLSGLRGNSTRELLCIGAANTVTPLLGGIAGSISLGATTANQRNGSRNSLSLFVHSLVFLLFVPLAAPLLGYIPKVVVAALVAQAGWQLFDRWTLQLLQRVAHRQTVNWEVIAVDIAVIALVAGIAISGKVVVAVIVGVSIAVLTFTLRMSRGVIRNARYGSDVNSRRTRDAAAIEVLSRHGRHILAVELEGPMFFASAEHLHNRIDDALAGNVRYVILDLARVNELDSSGARILLQTLQRAKVAGAHLLVCGHDEHHQTATMLVDQGVASAIGRDRMFADLDRALEWCENHILAADSPAHAVGAEHLIESMDLTRGLDARECGILQAELIRREYPPGATVFVEGTAGDALYIISRGAASVRLHLGEGESDIRLVTFSAGTLFGEMALLDREPRSATVTADEPLSCYLLERDRFERLLVEHPRIGQQLLANIARELSLRMRRANRTLASLV